MISKEDVFAFICSISYEPMNAGHLVPSGSISEHFKVSLSTAYRRLKELRKDGLIELKREDITEWEEYCGSYSVGYYWGYNITEKGHKTELANGIYKKTIDNWDNYWNKVFKEENK